MKILIVDDNKNDRKILRHYIENYGHEAIEADNGQTGFEMVTLNNPAIIISDALMPVMDGFQFLRKLKKDKTLCTIPFVFYSAVYRGDKDMDFAMSMGADAFIIKPKEPEEFWEELNPVILKGLSGQPHTVTTLEEEEEYFQKYSTVVVHKLEEKIAELEQSINERHQVELELQNEKDKAKMYFDIAGVMLVVLNPDGSVSQINQKGCDILGFEKNEIIGQNWFDFIPEKQKNKVKNDFFLLMNGELEQVEHLKSPVQTKEKEERLIAWHNAVLKDKSNKIFASVSSGNDITEQASAREERDKLEKRLRQAQKMEALGTLAGGIAHDFNNILSAILGYVELAQIRIPEDSKSQADLYEVIKAGERAKDLVQQILMFSRQTDIIQKPVKMRPIIKEALKLLRASLPSTIEILHDIKTGSLVFGDPTSIHQILMNLCTNASHSMQPEGGKLQIHLTDMMIDRDFIADHPELNPGLHINLKISDTGHGMSNEVADRIFEPFFTTKKKGEGTGMGLSVVHGIIQEMGGSIIVYSELGKGSAFNVYLPAIERREDPARIILEDIPIGTEKILLVDDEEMLIKVGRRLMESLGYEVTTKTSSLEALELFKKNPVYFDLVVTDLTMPQKSGDLLAREMLSIRPDIPIILCTGFSANISEDQAKKIGVQALVMKPILKKDLAKTIRSVLDNRGN